MLEKHLWKRTLWTRSGMQFSSKSLCCQGNWAYLENRPHCALTSVDKSKTKHLSLYHKGDYSLKLDKTLDCCKILSAQFNGLFGVASSVKIRREKHIFFLAPHGAPQCHGTLSILSITQRNHRNGLGLLTFIRILFSKCVCLLTLDYFRNVFVGKLT